jgi:hypothetical protein
MQKARLSLGGGLVVVCTACSAILGISDPTVDGGADGGSSSGGSSSSNGASSGASSGGGSGGRSSSGGSASGSGGTSSASAGSSGANSSSGGATGSGSGSGARSSSGGGTGSSNGASGSGSGAAGSSSSGSSGGASGSSGNDGGCGDGSVMPACSVTVTSGAVPLTDGYVTVVGAGGYPYAYHDAMGSTACLSTLALCGAGTALQTNFSGTTWGGGIGVSLNQPMATSCTVNPPVNPFTVTGSGIAYSLSNLPPSGVCLIIDDGGIQYYAQLVASAGTIPWSAFTTAACYVAPPGVALSGPPTTATHIQFQVFSLSGAGPFDFCVKALGFAP